MDREADTPRGRGDPALTTGLGTYEGDAVDAGPWIHFQYVSIKARTHTHK